MSSSKEIQYKIPSVAVFDIGKTNIKIVVIDSNNNLLFEKRKENKTLFSKPWPHYDTEGIWDWFLESLSSISDKYEITGIVPLAHAACAAVVDDKGLVFPIVDYEFEDIEKYSEEYDKAARDFYNTGSPKLPVGHNIGRLLFYQYKEKPANFKKAKYILTYPQYWAWKLSGIAASEVTSLGCHSDLWSWRNNDFSKFTKKLGWDKLFPPQRKAWESIGNIKKEIASKTGIPYNCKIYTGIHDSNASLLRYLAGRKNEKLTIVSSGTWVICFALNIPVRSNLPDDKDIVINSNIYGEPVVCSRFMGGREFSELVGNKKDITHKLNAVAIKRILNKNTTILPSFANQGGAFMKCKGSIEGEKIETDKELFVFASLYLAGLCNYSLELIGVKSGDIIIEGKLAKNDFFCRAFSRLRDKQNCYISDDITGTAAGAALLSAWPPKKTTLKLKKCKPLGIEAISKWYKNWISRLKETNRI